MTHAANEKQYSIPVKQCDTKHDSATTAEIFFFWQSELILVNGLKVTGRSRATSEVNKFGVT